MTFSIANVKNCGFYLDLESYSILVPFLLDLRNIRTQDEEILDKKLGRILTDKLVMDSLTHEFTTGVEEVP